MFQLNSLSILLFSVLALSCQTGPEVVDGAVPVSETTDKEVLEGNAELANLVSEDSAMEIISTVIAEDAKVKEGWETQVGRFDAEPEPLAEPVPLKEPVEVTTPAAPAVNFDHSLFNTVLGKYVNAAGDVNYTALKSDADLPVYLELLAKNPPRDTWPKKERMVYWINAYNAFTLKLIIDHMPLASIKDIGSPWKKDFIQIDGSAYDLNTIEHEILRKQFNDPRIHFAINCASASCPKLFNKAFRLEGLERQLEQAASLFINDPSKNRISADKAELSKIFDWFKGDFAKNDAELIAYVNRYAKAKAGDSAGISYMKYDWSLNGK